MNYPFKSYADALAPKPRIGYIVDGIIPAKSMTIWYGYPGSLKSMVVLDLAMAVAMGKPFLPSTPRQTPILSGRTTQQRPVVWLDVDTGEYLLEQRLVAVGSVYGAAIDTPFYYMSYPTVRGASSKSMAALTMFLENALSMAGMSSPLIVSDTLLRMAQVRDENSSEMDTVMYNLRKMNEDLDATMVLVSHANKMNHSGRAGNALRGHSSIEGGVDSVFRVKREDNSDIIEIENEKARQKPVETFSARFTYTSDPVNDELLSFRFYHVETQTPANKAQSRREELIDKIYDYLATNGITNYSTLFSAIKGKRVYFEDALNEAIKNGTVKETKGFKNAREFFVQ